MTSRQLTPLVVAVTSLVLLLTGCTVGENPVAERRTVTAHLTSSAGLFEGNDVGVLGVTVGRISSIEPQGATVKVTMRVDPDQPLPRGVGAVVVSRSAATDRYVELTPAYTSGPREPGDLEIPVQRTRVPVEFDEVLETMGSLSDDLAGSGPTRNAIRRLLASQSKAFKGRGDLMNRSIRSLSAATNGVSAQRQELTATLTALDGLTRGLARNETTVRAFVRQVSEASSMMADERHNFRASLRSVTRMIREVSAFVRENRKEIVTAVNRTNGVMRTVLDERRNAAEILRVGPLAMQNLRRMLKPNNRLLVRLDAAELTPAGGLLQRLCAAVPGDLCTAIGLDPTVVLDRLDDVFGGRGGRP